MKFIVTKFKGSTFMDRVSLKWKTDFEKWQNLYIIAYRWQLLNKIASYSDLYYRVVSSWRVEWPEFHWVMLLSVPRDKSDESYIYLQTENPVSQFGTATSKCQSVRPSLCLKLAGLLVSQKSTNTQWHTHTHKHVRAYKTCCDSIVHCKSPLIEAERASDGSVYN